MRRIRSVLVVPALVLAVSACFAHPAGARSVYGTISGTLGMEGGTAPGRARALIPGTVELSVHGHRVVTIHVPMTGTFRVRVPVGEYEVAAITPRIHEENSSGKFVPPSGFCAHPPITVTAGKRISIRVTCFVP
jgi:hypothetical protein